MDALLIISLVLLGALVLFGIWYTSKPSRKGALEINRENRKSRARPPKPGEGAAFYGPKAIEEIERLCKPGHRNTGLMFYYPSEQPGDKDFELVIIGDTFPKWLRDKANRADYLRAFNGPVRDDGLAMMRWLAEVAAQLHNHVAQLPADEVEGFELPDFFISALDFLMHHYSPEFVRERVMIALSFSLGQGGKHRGTHIVTEKVSPLINSFLSEWRAGTRRRKITVGSIKAVNEQISLPGQLTGG